MIENPYRSPASVETIDAEWLARQRALFSFRIATLVLLMPAVYNLWAFDAQAIAASGLPLGVATMYRTVNIFALVLGSILIWFFGVKALELLSRWLRQVFANEVDSVAWQGVLYRGLSWSAYLSVPGAALWAIWVFAFYQMKMDFTIISWAVGVPAHLLAACLYVPMIVGWHRLRQDESTDAGDDKVDQRVEDTG